MFVHVLVAHACCAPVNAKPQLPHPIPTGHRWGFEQQIVQKTYPSGKKQVYQNLPKLAVEHTRNVGTLCSIHLMNTSLQSPQFSKTFK